MKILEKSKPKGVLDEEIRENMCNYMKTRENTRQMRENT